MMIRCQNRECTEKPISEFGVQADGFLHTFCKPCYAEITGQREKIVLSNKIHDINGSLLKECPKCEKNKSRETDFYYCQRTNRSSGWCKACSREKAKKKKIKDQIT